MMNVLCIIKPSASLYAGLYAGVGRSLCRRRPVSMPASAGLYAGQPLFDCVTVPSVVFPAKTASQQKNVFIKKRFSFVDDCYFGKC